MGEKKAKTKNKQNPQPINATRILGMNEYNSKILEITTMSNNRNRLTNDVVLAPKRIDNPDCNNLEKRL